MTPANFRPSEVSRLIVHVVLRDRTSTSPDCSAVKRSLAESGVNFTLVGSLKIAAASARQKSTSRPVQLFCSSGKPKPMRLVLLPHWINPLALTSSSVPAEAAETAATLRPTPKASDKSVLFIVDPFSEHAAALNLYLLRDRIVLAGRDYISPERSAYSLLVTPSRTGIRLYS